MDQRVNSSSGKQYKVAYREESTGDLTVGSPHRLTDKTDVNHRVREAVHQVEPNNAHTDAGSNQDGDSFNDRP